MKRSSWLLALIIGLWTLAAMGEDSTRKQRVLYVGNSSSARAKGFGDFLRKRFREVRIASRVGFDPKTARDADVVLLDWSQSETQVDKAVSPFGRLEDWSKPTVLLGSAGLLLAGQWEVIGGAG